MGTDAITDLTHDHGDLNRRVLDLGAALRRATRDPDLATKLAALREQLFFHFAREEEGLFPFVAEHLPALATQVDEMAVAHDAICGALARMCHMAASEAELSLLGRVFERFEAAYGAHAAVEANLLKTLDGAINADQRTQLAALVRGL
jgi:iron-sulfur cluster repair protein YtfE (RIC family)